MHRTRLPSVNDLTGKLRRMTGSQSVSEITLPPFVEASERLRGRNVRAGYQRGWGLQFGDLHGQILKDDLYQHALERAKGRTVVSEWNRMNLYLILRLGFNGLAPGHILEFGAYRGGNAIFMAEVCKVLHPGTKIYAFDTFEGMPAVDTSRDAHRAGNFADIGLEELKELIAKYDLSNLELVRGTFESTAKTALDQIKSVRLAHIDCDIYSAVVHSYDVTIPYMVEGGYWAFDDALYSSCIGAMEAIEEVVIQRDGRFAEQSWPHLVYRNFSPNETRG
jgi:predicted O-methyltransferase YrrM